MFELVVKNGQLITAHGPISGELGIRGEQIAAIGTDLPGAQEIDATGCYILPGGVDCHVHLQMQLDGLTSTDSFASGTIAAACGGTTTVIDFTDPQPGQFLLEALAQRQEEARYDAAVDFGLHMTIPTWHGSADERLYEIPDAVAAGCATFKLYQAYNRMELDDVALLRVMRAVAGAGGGVVLHSETGPLLEVLRRDAMAAGHLDPIWHERTRPAPLEATALHRAAEIARLADCPLHIFHVGAGPVLAQVRAARQRGLDISAETCPHYLLLTAEEHLAGENGQLFICAPPLRGPADQSALWAGLADGSVEIVSTDHCPWTRQEKWRPAFAHVPGGLPGIEARLALVHHFGVRQRGLSLARWVQACCTAPARRMGLARKGALLPGFDADVVIFDPQRQKSLTPETLHEAADWTPFDGLTVQGWPRTVLLRGRAVVQEEAFVGRPGQGQFVARTHGKAGDENL